MNSTKAAGNASNVAAHGAVTINTNEKNKQWQREFLMERIRSHASQHKSFPELSKNMRMSMLEKRYALDSVEKLNLQKSLDSMQHCIKVTSRQGLVERLESLSRQLGLKFMEDSNSSVLFISTDMFYLEIILDANGVPTDVKVHHECNERQSSSELVNCLKRGDFADFTEQLEGLSSIYQLNAEPKVKTKAFVAMMTMETDIHKIYELQNCSNDAQQILSDSAVGYVMKRRGGHPMKLIYFVTPYDLISLETKSMQSLNTDLLRKKQIGMSVTVNLEASSANKLQIVCTVAVTHDPRTGCDLPFYAPLTSINSMLLPATFVLRLNKPLPVCYAGLRALGVGIGGETVGGVGSTVLEGQHKAPVVSTIMNLVVQTASENTLKNSHKGLFVCLPDQTHCYFFSENKQLTATMISYVPFTEPAQVPKIVVFLKKQALFYTLLSTCVRSQSKMGNDMDSTTILEVNATSYQQIAVSLQHPYEESMATVEFDLTDGLVQCNIYTLSRNYDLLSAKLTAIVQKSHSIPVTIRALLKFWDKERMEMFQRNNSLTQGNVAGNIGGSGNVGGYGNFNLVMGPNDSGGSRGGSTSNTNTIKMEPNLRQQIQSNSDPTTSVSSNGAAGFLKFKSEFKREDFHECPKSVTLAVVTQPAVEACSLGVQSPQQQQQLISKSKATDIEIADKYKNIWKDKTANLKNCVSITPISVEGKSIPQNLDMKRSGGIEIIPLTAQLGNNGGNGAAAAPNLLAPTTSSTITITPINASSNTKDNKKTICAGTGANISSASSSSSSSPIAISSSSSSASVKRTLDSTTVSSADAQKEKKRKKKRDDSPMGPPEKVYSRQNSPAALVDSNATAAGRKFPSPSSSPKGGSGGILSATTTGSSSLPTRPSPKHSPVYSSSPKHNTASNSPKSPFGTHSPKHGSSGKPSMSTLKSAAATGLSPKADKSVSSCLTTGPAGNPVTLVRCSLPNNLQSSGSVTAVGSTSSSSISNASALPPIPTPTNAGVAKNRERERTPMSSPNPHAVSSGIAGTSVAGKTNMSMSTANTAMQQLKPLTAALNHITAAGNLSGVASTAVTIGSIELNTAAMRKGVTGAVSLMTSKVISPTAPITQVQPQMQQPPLGNNESTIPKSPSKSSEYMVKSSQEGLKLTINKTTNKFPTTSTSTSKSKFNGSSSAAGISSILALTSAAAKKQHTGLKPGVNSGPASKKNPSSSFNLTAESQSSKHIFQKSNSSGSLNAKLSTTSGLVRSNSTNSFADIIPTKTTTMRRLNSNGSTNKKVSERNSISSASTSLTARSATTRLDHDADMLKILQYASPTMTANMEGFMKGFGAKFQIPKLSHALKSPSANLTPLINNNASAVTQNTTATAVVIAENKIQQHQDQQPKTLDLFRNSSSEEKLLADFARK